MGQAGTALPIQWGLRIYAWVTSNYITSFRKSETTKPYPFLYIPSDEIMSGLAPTSDLNILAYTVPTPT